MDYVKAPLNFCYGSDKNGKIGTRTNVTWDVPKLKRIV